MKITCPSSSTILSNLNIGESWSSFHNLALLPINQSVSGMVVWLVGAAFFKVYKSVLAHLCVIRILDRGMYVQASTAEVWMEALGWKIQVALHTSTYIDLREIPRSFHRRRGGRRHTGRTKYDVWKKDGWMHA